MYRHWTKTDDEPTHLRYHYDGPDNGDGEPIALEARKELTGPTEYHDHIEWHVSLLVGDIRVYEFADEYDDIPAVCKADAIAFVARWMRVHPKPLTAAGVTDAATETGTDMDTAGMSALE